jgi:hypothetical protein
LVGLPGALPARAVRAWMTATMTMIFFVDAHFSPDISAPDTGKQRPITR